VSPPQEPNAAEFSGPGVVAEATSDPESPLQWSPPGLLDATALVPVPPPLRNPRTITLFSPKGGVGTTFLAVNIAVALAERGRRRVCVVDLDLAFGDVAIVAGLAPSRGISDAVGQALEDDETIDAVLTTLSPGVDCVLAPIDPAAADDVSTELVSSLLARLRERYEFIVVDTPCQLSELVLEVLDVSDFHVLVTTPALPALKNLRLLVDTLDLLGMDESARVIVLNQVDARTGLQQDDVEEILGQPVAAALPATPDVPASIELGTPLLGRRRDTVVAAGVRAFVAQTLLEDSAPTRSRSRPRLGLITRMRSS
jgi:pilus assembly protein CpaE